MAKEDIHVLSYNEVLEAISEQENHLLIGNGFNYGLDIDTGYKAIFKKMIENEKGVYQDAIPLFKECNSDLELFIGQLESDIVAGNIFLKKYVRNKIKFDFMRATHELVKSEIKNIYAEKNEGIFLLLKNFTNFFTLNYDSFLYLLLLQYKSPENDIGKVIALQPSLKFIEDDLNETQNNIYTEIKNARENGKLKINFSNDVTSEKSLKKLTKSHFTAEISSFSKTENKGWKAKDIERVVKTIFEEEKRNNLLTQVDDGFRQLSFFEDDFVYNIEGRTQNLFFLHGAFHIYKDGDCVKKITQQSDKALYDKLEDVLNSDNQEVICVFQHTGKTEVIDENNYLKNCLNKLNEINGKLVIIGSSLADNDNHIFNRINQSQIEAIYISTLLSEKDSTLKTAKEKFPSKKVILFDAKTISYEIPESLGDN